MNKTSFITTAAIMTAIMMMMTAGTTAMAKTFTVSDHPSSMDILRLINMHNENNPQQPIVCSSGFVFPESHVSSSGGSGSSSIANQVAGAINDATDGIHVTVDGDDNGNDNGGSSSDSGKNPNFLSEKDRHEILKHTSTPDDVIRSATGAAAASDSSDNNDKGGNGDDGASDDGGGSIGGVETDSESD
jgi:hypothetical protein